MGLVAAFSINAAYWVELHFLLSLIRPLLNARKNYLFLTVFVFLGLAALGLNLFIFIGIFTLMGFDTDFVGAAFVFMGSGFISLIILFYIFAREVWNIFYRTT